MASIDHPVEFTLEFLKQLKEKKTKEERNEIFEKWLSGPIDEDVKHTAHIFYYNSINDLESLYKFFNTTDILTISAEKTLHPNRTDKRKKILPLLKKNLANPSIDQNQNIHTLMLIYLFSYRIKKFRDPLDKGNPLHKVTRNELLIIMNIACKINCTESEYECLYDPYSPEEKRKLAAEEIGFFVEHMDKLTKYDNLSLIYAAEAIPYLVDTEKKPEDPQTKSAAVSLATSPPTHPSSEHLEDAAGSAASGSPAAVAAEAPIDNQPHGLGTDDIESPALEPEPQSNCSNIMAFFSCICCCCGNKKKGADVAYDEKAEKLLGS